MPSKTKNQARFFAACAHGANYKSCPPKKVSKEFNKADKKTGILKNSVESEEFFMIREILQSDKKPESIEHAKLKFIPGPSITFELDCDGFLSASDLKKDLESQFKRLLGHDADNLIIKTKTVKTIAGSYSSVTANGPVGWILRFLDLDEMIDNIAKTHRIANLIEKTSSDFYYITTNQSTNVALITAEYGEGLLKFFKDSSIKEIKLMNIRTEEIKNRPILKAIDIINKNISSERDLVSCKRELIALGLKQFAKV